MYHTMFKNMSGRIMRPKYWENKGEYYTECKPCIEKCLSCVNSSICYVCKDGTYPDKYSESRNYCAMCHSSCEKCSTIASCSACRPGYFGTACEFGCITIIAGCQLCDWDDVSLIVTCSQCDIGWTLEDNKCMEAAHQCPINCERCAENNLCEVCKTGWIGALCDKTCHNISNCIACHEADESILCNLCDEGYAVMNGECRATLTYTKVVRPTSTPSTLASNRQITISEPPVCKCNTPMPQLHNTRFQTSAFVIGLVAGIGLCTCVNLLTVLVCFLRRRKRLQNSTISRQNEPFYENSFAANESHLTTMDPDGSNQENIQQMRIVEENDREPVDDQHHSPDGESISTYTNIEQHDYTSLNVRQGEHIYKELTTL